MAGTVTEAVSEQTNIQKITLTCVGDAADGSFPATVIAHKFSGRIIEIVTNPGATAPTANYDIVVNRETLDVLQGVGANRHTSATEAAPVVFSGTSLHPIIHESDTLTLAVSGNSVNSAIVVIDIYIALGA
jgi:hypothetical protein